MADEGRALWPPTPSWEFMRLCGRCPYLHLGHTAGCVSKFFDLKQSSGSSAGHWGACSCLPWSLEPSVCSQGKLLEQCWTTWSHISIAPILTCSYLQVWSGALFGVLLNLIGSQQKLLKGEKTNRAFGGGHTREKLLSLARLGALPC